jgi:hypothetical protein
MAHANYLAAFPSPEWRDALVEITAYFDRQLMR